MLTGRSGSEKREGRPALSGAGRRALAAVALVAALSLGTITPAQDEPGGGPRRGERGPRIPPRTLAPGTSCLECHADLLQRRTVHEPAKEGCETCHRQRGLRHEFSNTVSAKEMCSRCHELGLEGKVHGPVGANLCTTCHDPHGADLPRLVKAPERRLCSTCHAEVKGPRKRYVHGPFAVGICQVCHEPHASKNEGLLRRPGRELCLGCHDQLAPSAPATWHAPVQDTCTLCHSGHETDTRYMLVSEQPDLCLRCHRNIADTLERSAVRHQAITEGGCVGCHEPHVSPFSRLLKAEAADLCLSCHDREYPQARGRPFPDMAEFLEENPNRHGPVREKNCEGCHQPHGSANFRLLVEAYPPTFYAPFLEKNFALCFSCHPKELVEESDWKLTSFRDGPRNLHYLHVNRRKGRTCRACHETHASRLPHHIRETTPFGDWDLPIGYRETETGGSCEPGCHQPVRYDRGDE